MKHLIILLILSGCMSQLSSRMDSQPSQQLALFEEVRVALVDVQQTLNAQKLDIDLLEEKLAKLENLQDDSALQQRIASLEKTQQLASSDLHALNKCLKEAASGLSEVRQQISALDHRLSYESERLGEVTNLRTTLSSLTKAMSSSAQASSKVHRVRAGDSLEKIARQYQTSIEEIKNINGITSNKILVGQELKIP